MHLKSFKPALVTESKSCFCKCKEMANAKRLSQQLKLCSRILLRRVVQQWMEEGERAPRLTAGAEARKEKSWFWKAQIPVFALQSIYKK